MTKGHHSVVSNADANPGDEIAARARDEESARLAGEIIDHMAEGVQLTRVDTREIVFANPRFEQMFGYDAGELIGKPVTVLSATGKKSPEDTTTKIIRSLQETGTWSGEIQNVKKDGTPFWCTAVVSTFEHSRYGTVWVSVQQDITERKRAEDDLRKSEQRYRGLFDRSHLSIWEEDFSAVGRWIDDLRDAGVEDLDEYLDAHPDAVVHAVKLVRIVAVNRGTLELFEAETMDQFFRPSAPPMLTESVDNYSNEVFVEQLKAIWNGIGKVESEFSVTTFEGRRVDCLLRWAPAQVDGLLDLSCVIVSIEDVTERKRADKNRKSAEARFRHLFEHMPDAVVILDPETTMPVEFNDLAPRMLGYSREEFSMLRISDYEASETPGEVHKHVDSILRDGEDEFETRMRTKQGEILDVSVSVRVVEIGGRNVLQSVRKNITHRKRTEAAAREREENLRRMIEHMPVLVNAFDSAGRIAVWNRECELVTGYSADEMVGDSGALDLLYPDRSVSEGTMLKWMKTGSDFRGREWDLVAKDGRVKTVVWSNLSKEFPIAGWASWSIGLDVSERKESERALRESEERIRTILDGVADGIITIDPQGMVSSFNAAAEKIFGYRAEEMMGRNVTALMPNPDRLHHDDYLQQYHRTGEHKIIGVRREVVGVRKDGSSFPMELHISELVMGDRQIHTGVVTDITNRKRAEERAKLRESELAHVSRLVTLGEMAGGLAHELNQPLAAMANYTEACIQTLRSDSRDDSSIRTNLERISAMSNRAGLIIRRLRGLVRKQEPSRTATQVNLLVSEVVNLIAHEAKLNDVTILQDLAEPLPPILADSIQIQQVILNLIRNGIEAIRDARSERRNLAIRTRHLEAGNVELSVSDSGPGIGDDVAQTLFAPFVTTKPQGLGMGLSISETIVRAHEGRLWAEPGLEEGAIFRMTLPSCESSAEI